MEVPSLLPSKKSMKRKKKGGVKRVKRLSEKTPKEKAFEAQVQTSCPLTIGGKEMNAHIDTQSAFFFVKLKVWEELEGTPVYDSIKYTSFQSENKVTCVKRKRVLIDPHNPMRVVEGDDCVALLSMEVAALIGIHLSCMPTFFKSRANKVDVEEWLKSTGAPQLSEKTIPHKEREDVLLSKVLKAIQSNNERVPKNSFCTLEGCKFVIDLKEGTRPTFTRQYGCPEALLRLMKQRMNEWLEAAWVEPFLDGGKNLYNSLWLAVAKKSGGKVAVGDLRLCMDFQVINKWTLELEYFILRTKDLLSKVWGMKVFTELDLENAYHQIPLHPNSKKVAGFYFPGKGQFMGLMVDRERRGIDIFKAKVFNDMSAPKSGKDVQAILGFVNFLRDFIPLYASLATPLKVLRKTKKITPELWRKSGGEKAFEVLKQVLLSALLLHAPNFDLPFIMETDASQYGVGAVLYQEDVVKGERYYINFAAKALFKSQMNYPAAKRELLAGLFGMKRWRNWLLFRKFEWGMDNKALTYINNSEH